MKKITLFITIIIASSFLLSNLAFANRGTVRRNNAISYAPVQATATLSAAAPTAAADSDLETKKALVGQIRTLMGQESSLEAQIATAQANSNSTSSFSSPELTSLQDSITDYQTKLDKVKADEATDQASIADFKAKSQQIDDARGGLVKKKNLYVAGEVVAGAGAAFAGYEAVKAFTKKPNSTETSVQNTTEGQNTSTQSGSKQPAAATPSTSTVQPTQKSTAEKVAS